MKRIFGYICLGSIGFLVLWSLIVAIIYATDLDSLDKRQANFNKDGKAYVTQTQWDYLITDTTGLTDEALTQAVKANEIVEMQFVVGAKEVVTPARLASRAVKYYKIQIEVAEKTRDEDNRILKIDYADKTDAQKETIDKAVAVNNYECDEAIANAKFEIAKVKDEKADTKWDAFSRFNSQFWSFFGLSYTGVILPLLTFGAYIFLKPCCKEKNASK
ncbi:MAG: hypothetical protein LBQ05_00735 [Christensenellaceae bacterium]|jgi:hypothetical protein|nr:hypothetical protein [Christensenellaceae bacterium]